LPDMMGGIRLGPREPHIYAWGAESEPRRWVACVGTDYPVEPVTPFADCTPPCEAGEKGTKRIFSEAANPASNRDPGLHHRLGLARIREKVETGNLNPHGRI